MNQTPQTKTARWQLLALTCALVIAPSAWSQTKAPAPAETAAKAPVPVTTTPSKHLEDEQVVLSPFVVTTGKDTGYFAANTLAGSRMNTNLADLGASISVVTKAQMEDFASVDLNDAFRYELNTEGSGTYTPATQAFRNDGVLDVNAGGTQGNNVASLTNATANRVRGIGIPSAATNYYPSIAAIPPDAYNVQSFEISRGPNSMLFGLGSPAGIANSTTAQAQVDRNTNQVQLRTDDRGSFRSSLSFNRSLIDHKLAIFGALLYDDRQFVRKPSYDITRRQYGAITFKPFSKTSIRANFENYDNRNRRPNTISPVDYITQWNLAGRPIYDNLTKKITITATGQVVGPYISSAGNNNVAAGNLAQQVRTYVTSLPNYNPALISTSAAALNSPGTTVSNFTFYNGQPIYGGTTSAQLFPTLTAAAPSPYSSVFYVPGMSQLNSRAYMTIANGQLQNWYQPLYNQTYTTGYAVPGGGPAAPPNVNNPISNIWNNAASSDIYERNSYVSGGWTNNSFVSNIGGAYRYPGVTNRAIYDYKKINILQADYGSQKNKNYNIDFDQEITHDLFLSGGWFRQDFKQSSNYTIGQLNATAVRIDENKYNPDGTPNPYVGLPFVQDQDPDRYLNQQIDDHFRAMLAYTPDFRQNKGWLKWLGHHQILGLWSRDESMAIAIRQRLNYIAAATPSAMVRYVANPTPNLNGTRTGWNFGGATQRLYYLANPGDPQGKISSSSGEWNPDTFTGDIKVYNYGTSSFENANVTETYNTFADPSRSQRTLQSWSGGITSYLWQDRITTTFGARLDKFKARNTTSAAITLADGTVIPQVTPQQKFLPTGYFDLSSIYNRFQPWSRATGRTKTGGGVFRPFRGWASIDKNADSGNQFWQFVRDFGLVYNWSNNFDAPSGAQVDAFGKPLPNPQGIGRDVGFQFTALDNKLFARVTWFRSNSLNQRLSAGTAIGRLTAQVPVTTPDSSQASVDALFKGWARTIAKINLGINPSVDPTINPISPQQELDVQAAAAKIWSLPYNYYEALPGSITATGDAVATGMEIQVNYNTKNWRNRITFGKQTTTNFKDLLQYDAWYAVRSPVWAAAKATNFLLPQYQNLTTFTQGTGTAVDITNFLTSYGYNSTVKITNAQGGRNVQDWIDVNLTPQVQLARDLQGQQAPGQRKYRWAYNTGYDFTTGRLRGIGIGGAERWEAKSVIGYYGKSGGTSVANPKLLDLSDTTRPIHDGSNFYTDLFVNYKTKVWRDKVGLTVQLNVENVFEDGHLQTVAVNYDGSPYGYRIIDSRKFTLTTTFNF